MTDEIMVHKATLSTGKVVILRDLKIKHQRLAAQAAAGKAGENATALGIQMAEEMIKLLIVKIDGKAVPGAKLEDLDELFTFSEYQEVLKVMGTLMGGEVDSPKMEVVSSGQR